MEQTKTEPNIDLGPLNSLPPRTFETERLKLRALKPEDSKLIFNLYASDPVATKYMSFKCTGRLEDTEAFVIPAASYFLGKPSEIKHFVWVLELKSTGEPIGTTGIGPKNDYALTGGYILNQKWWGHGYASEAWKCILDWAKTQPRVYRIDAWHDLDNPASGRVMQKAGMTFEGILRKNAMVPNTGDIPRDEAVYAWVR